MATLLVVERVDVRARGAAATSHKDHITLAYPVMSRSLHDHQGPRIMLAKPRASKGGKPENDKNNFANWAQMAPPVKLFVTSSEVHFSTCTLQDQNRCLASTP